MASLIDVLGKRTETEGSSSYQRVLVREISKKLNELEEQNDQNAASIDELKKLQKSVLTKMEGMKTGSDGSTAVSSGIEREELEDLLGAVMEHIQDRIDAGNQDMEDLIAEKIAAQDTKTAEQIDRLEEILAAYMEEDRKSAPDNSELLEHMDSMRLSLEDTVHKENIKCFRNVQGALEEQEDGNTFDVKGLRKYLRTIIWFQIIIIVLLVLKMTGIV